MGVTRNDPYPNFHAARVRDPGGFQNIVVLKTLPNGVMIYGGRLKGQTTTTVQAYRFPKSKFTAQQAKEWLKSHKVKYTKFEPATGGDSADEDFEMHEEFIEEDAGSISVNSAGKSFANSLISQGKIDFSSDWSFSAADGNKLLGANGEDWATFEKHHLAVDTSESEETKARYKYPFAKKKGDSSVIFRRGVIAVKARAAQQGQTSIASAADSLLKAIDKKKKDEWADDQTDLTNVERSDFFLLPFLGEEDDWIESKFDKTPEGYLKGRAIVTNIGVFTYFTADGGIRRELRLPDEVFEKESMDSLKMIPLTYGHPVLPVDNTNIKDHQVGSTGDDIRKDSYHLSAPLVINDPEAVKAITEDQRQAISCGYRCDIEMKSGNWMGVPYDAIQRNIRYNHIAVGIESGRAGDDVIIKLDECGAYCLDNVECFRGEENKHLINNSKNKNDKESDMALKKITIDGIEYEAEEGVIKAYNQVKTDAEEWEGKHTTLAEEKSTLQGQHDTLKDENDTLKQEKEDAEKKLPEKIQKAVDAKIELLATARENGVEVKNDDSDRDIKVEVIKKAFPKKDDEQEEFNKKLDEADDTYIQARFDAAVEYLKEHKDDDPNEDEEDASDFSKTDHTDEGEQFQEGNADKKRDAMIKRMQDDYKDEEK